MPDTPTPGQVAYETWRNQQPRAWLHEQPLPWRCLDAPTHAEWEAVAQAVLEEERTDFRFAVAQHVTWAEAPGAVWEIASRHYHESRASVWITYDLIPAAGDTQGFVALSAYEPDLAAAEEGRP